jgi:hypothetical protein
MTNTTGVVVHFVFVATGESTASIDLLDGRKHQVHVVAWRQIRR